MICIYRDFCPKKDKVTGVPGKVDYDKLYDFDSSPDIICVIKEDEVGRTCGAHLGGENTCRLLVGKPEVT